MQSYNQKNLGITTIIYNNRVEVISSKYGNDINFQKPINEISNKI
jgi:hypothetical protein